MHGTLTIARLTWLEARRRRIVLAGLLGGLAYLLVFGLAVHLILRHAPADPVADAIQYRLQMQVLTLAGLYVANFLVIAAAILLPVDTLSGEIASGVMQTLASKPIRRVEILLGKWLAYCAMTACYLGLMTGGVAAIMWIESGYLQVNLVNGMPLLLLGALVMTTVTIAGGTRLTTVANGMLAFALYGIAFIAGWIEQIGTATGSDAARRIGTAISLASPVDAMWRKAAYDLQPAVMRQLLIASPFGSGSVPSTLMIVWTVGFVVVTLCLGILLFRKRPL